MYTNRRNDPIKIKGYDSVYYVLNMNTVIWRYPGEKCHAVNSHLVNTISLIK